MTAFETIAIVLVITAILSLVNITSLKLPETIGVMALTLILSLTLISLEKFLPAGLSAACERIANFDFSGFVLHIALGFLIFAGAFSSDTSALAKERIPIFIFATLGIVISTVVVGVLTSLMLNFIGLTDVSFLHCLLFGALISPTDPIAVLAILKKAGVSKELNADITGESLLNDGVAVVVFLTLFQLAEGSESPNGGVIANLLLLEVGGGILFGAALAFLGTFALRITRDPQMDILITLSLVSGGYVAAESLHLSAPLAMVVAGIWLGLSIRKRDGKEEASNHIFIFWESLDFIFNAVLFVLLGVVVVGLSHIFDAKHILAGLFAIGIVLVARIISLALTIPLTPLRNPHPARTLALLSWGGLRGAISVALALSLTADMNRDLFVQMTYVVVVFSVLVQGVSIGTLAKKLKSSNTKF